MTQRDHDFDPKTGLSIPQGLPTKADEQKAMSVLAEAYQKGYDDALFGRSRMSWVQMPTAPGWWFFAKSLKDWDLSQPMSVSRHEYTDGMIAFHLRGEHRIAISPTDGWWYGPFRVQRPEGQV